MRLFPIFLIIFWTIIILNPEIIAYLIWWILLILWINMLLFKSLFSFLKNKWKKEDYVKFGKYKIYR